MLGNIFKKDEDGTTQPVGSSPTSPGQTTGGQDATPSQTQPTPSAFSSAPTDQPSAPVADSSQMPASPVANASGSDVPQDALPQTQDPMASSPDGSTNQQDATPASTVDQSTVNPGAAQGGGANVSQDDMQALSHLDSRAAQALTHAQEETRRLKQQNIEPEQVLLGLLHDQQVYNMLNEMGTDGGQLSKEIQVDEKMGTYQGQPLLSKISQEVFDQAYRDAKMRGANFISPEDVLIVLFSPNYKTAQYLQKHNLKKEAVVEKFSKSPTTTYGKRSMLEKYGTDLTEEAKAGKLDPIAGRDKEIDRMVHILLRRTKNNPIIIGETGVGKTAIVEGLAQKIVSGNVPKDLQDKRIFQLDVASLVAGASHRGEFEERLRGVISEVLGSNNRIILFIDEIHALLGGGDDGGMNAANIIKPHLARGHFQLIGATTTIEYRKNFEKDKAFERRFQPVTAEEPSEENALEMLKVIRPKYEKFHHVTLPDDALKECVKLSKKYIGERYLPDKAVDLLDEAASHVKLEIDAGKRNSGESTVRKADIEKVVSTWTGIPITKLTEDESAKLLKLEDRIHQRLIDQEEAVAAVSEAVRRGRIGLAAANRPIASFVFLGPTGVGKTELAKTLAELLFGRDDAMARLDMSEYMEKHEVAKLIGAPPGYVGYEEGGQLTEAVRKKPYSIVLMDEIEKAHPDVFNILLQLLEDGRLTDNKGNTVSFKNTIVICTSNIGSAVIQQHLSAIDPKAKRNPDDDAKNFKDLQAVVREELIKFFRPELLNRFDEVVIFKPLAQEHMAGIARLGIAKTAKLLKEQGYNLQITERAVAQLAKDGYDPVYGARPLRRLIQTAIENPIALAIISKKFVPGDTIVIDFNATSNEFSFGKSGGVADVAPMTDEQFRTFLVELNNPDSVTNVIDRQHFAEVHDLVVKGRTENNKTANAMLEVTVGTDLTTIQTIRKELEIGRGKGDQMSQAVLELASTVTHQIQATLELKHIILQIIQPDSIVQPARKLRFTQLHDKVTQESERQNELALKIMAVNDSTPADTIDDLMEMIKTGAANGEDLATEILSAVNNEITEETEAIHQAEPVTQFKRVLEQVINPLYLADPDDKAKFSQIHDKLSQANKSGNPIAAEILALTDITSDSDIQSIQLELEKASGQGDTFAQELLSTINEAIAVEPLRKLKTALLLITNPVNAQSSQEREQYTELQSKIATAGQKGNQLATDVLSVKPETPNETLKQLLNNLVSAYPQNDEVAVMVISLIGGINAVSPRQTQQTSVPVTVVDSAPVIQPAPVQAAPAVAPASNVMGVPTPAPGAMQPAPAPMQNTQFTPPPPPVQSAFVSSPPPPPMQPAAPVAPLPPQGGMLATPAAPGASQFGSVTPVDSTSGVVGSVVTGNGSMMQPSGAYNYSGIPLSSRPMGYVSPQTRQEDVE